MSQQDAFNEQVRGAREDVRRAQERARAARENWRRWQSGQDSARAAAAKEEWRRAGESLAVAFKGLEHAWKSFEQGWSGAAPPPKPTEINAGQRPAAGEDDLVQLAGEKLRDFLEPKAPDPAKERLRLERERLREERRRSKRMEGQADLMATGVGLAAGGLASLAVPLVAAVGAGLLAGGGAGLLLRLWTAREQRTAPPPLPAPPPRPAQIAAPTINAEGLNSARLDTVRTVLEHAAEQLREAQAAGVGLTDPDVRALLERLAATGQQIIDRVAERPELLPRAQRVLTYHVERAGYLAETLAAMLASSAAQPSQIEAAKHVLARMDNLFERTALELAAGDAREMDLELKLIAQALDEDLKP